MKKLRSAITQFLACMVLAIALPLAPTANAETPKADPEKVKELIEKIRAHRKAKEEEREKKRKEWEERRRQRRQN